MLLHMEEVLQPAWPLHQPLGHPEMHQDQQLQQQQQPPQQSSPAMVVRSGHNSLSLTGSVPGAIGSGTTTPGSSSNQGPEANNQFLGKRKIQDLVLQVPQPARMLHQPLGHPKMHQDQQLQQQQPPPQQSYPAMVVPSGDNSLSLTGSEPDATGSGTMTPGSSSSQGLEANKQCLGKRTIQDLVLQVDPQVKVDPEVEKILLEIADDFIDSVTTFACNLAKHRKSSTLESKDVLLHLEKNWNLTIPGFSSEDEKHHSEHSSTDLCNEHLEMTPAMMEASSLAETSTSSTTKETVSPGLGDHVGSGDIIGGPSSEELASPSDGEI